MRAFVRRVLPAQTVAVYAEPLNGDRALVDINSALLIPPASCVKLTTAAASLSELGVDYRFKTAFLTAAKPRGPTVTTLYVKGNGDPFVTPEALWRMARDLVDHGVTRIRGDAIIDDSFFAGSHYPHKDSGNYNAYEAPIGAVTANFNTVEFIVGPGPTAGSPAHVAVDPPAPYIRMINKVKTGPAFRVYVSRDVSDDHETFTLRGTVKLGQKLETMARSIARPTRYAASLFAMMLEQNGVKLDGAVKPGKVPETAYPFFESPSRPLALLVRDMNKFSSNFIAEQIVQHLGGLRTGKPATTPRGLMAVREWLSGIGIERDAYVLENGSGLSAKSLMTAEQLVRILKEAARDPAIGPDFVSSLAILGVDGTMRHWHGAQSLRGKLRAKTGTLRGIAALAGFVPDASGNPIVFAIMTRGLGIGINEAREAQLKVVERISAFTP